MKNKEHNLAIGDKLKVSPPKDVYIAEANKEYIFNIAFVWDKTQPYAASGNVETDKHPSAYSYLKESLQLDKADWIVKSKLISKEELLSLIEAQKKRGVYFTVWFIKKDGTERKMTCRFGVKKHLHGGKSTLDESKFFTVYSMADADYRAVSKETVFKVKVGGLVYELDN